MGHPLHSSRSSTPLLLIRIVYKVHVAIQLLLSCGEYYNSNIRNQKLHDISVFGMVHEHWFYSVRHNLLVDFQYRRWLELMILPLGMIGYSKTNESCNMTPAPRNMALNYIGFVFRWIERCAHISNRRKFGEISEK